MAGRTAAAPAGTSKRKRREERLDDEVARAIRKAERQYRAAVREYERAARVVCNPKVARAAEELKAAGRAMSDALETLAFPVGKRIGWVVDRDAESLCGLLHDLGDLDSDTSASSAGMLEYVLRSLPDRDAFDDWLVHAGRRVLDAFARLGKLERTSPEFARVQELVDLRYRPRTREGRREDLAMRRAIRGKGARR